LVTIFGYLADVVVTPEPLAPLFAKQLKTLPARLAGLDDLSSTPAV
jgi:hypothetical protein